jgi:hypothetical protein
MNILPGIAAFFMLLCTLAGFKGANGVRIFERKHKVFLQWACILCVCCAIEVAIRKFPWTTQDPLFYLEILGYVGLALWFVMIISRISTTITHGKKFGIMALYSLGGFLGLIIIKVLLYFI